MYLSYQDLVKKKVSNEWDYLVNSQNSYLSKIFNIFVNFIVLNLINKDLVEEILKLIKKKKMKNILEFGCGRATTSKLISEKFINNTKKLNIYVVDNNSKVITYLKKYPFHIIKADCMSKSLKLKPRSFDLAFSSGTFEHFQYPNAYIKNISKISKKFIITCPAKSFFWNIGTFIRSFTDTESNLWEKNTIYYDIKTLKKVFQKHKHIKIDNIKYTYLFGIRKMIVASFKVLKK